jgi:hypothetical protein
MCNCCCCISTLATSTAAAIVSLDARNFAANVLFTKYMQFGVAHTAACSISYVHTASEHGVLVSTVSASV